MYSKQSLNTLFSRIKRLSIVQYLVGKHPGILVLLSILFFVPFSTIQTVSLAQTLYFATPEDAFRNALNAFIQQEAPGKTFDLGKTHSEGEWAYAVAQELDAHGQPVFEQYVVILAHHEIGQGWYALIPKVNTNQQYNTLLNRFPDSLIDESSKAYFFQHDPTLSLLANFYDQVHKLPWPDGQTGRVTNKNGSGHVNQIDFVVSGDIYATWPGKVVFVKESSSTNCTAPPPDSCWKKANMVVVQHKVNPALTRYSWYVHLAYNSVPVKVGDIIEFGTKIGRQGNTGYSTGNHLHYMVSTGHTSWTNPSNPNDAPWATGILAMDFKESSWAGLTVGSQHMSKNRHTDIGENTSRSQLFVDAFNRNGGQNKLGFAQDWAQWWNGVSGTVVAQPLTGFYISGGRTNGAIVHDEPHDSPSGTIPAYVVLEGVWELYTSMGGPTSFLGPVTSDEFTNAAGHPQSNFAGGYIAYDPGSNSWRSHKWPTSFSGWKAEYYNNKNLRGHPTMVRNEPSPNHDWQENAPENGKIGVLRDKFSVRWTRTQYFSGGTYRFTTLSDDGVRVWVDNKRIINSWTSGGGQRHNGDIQLSSGDHTVKIEYFEDYGPAYFNISWTRDTAPPPPTSYTIFGKVTKLPDTPVPGAIITAVGGYGDLTTTTNANGEYIFTGLAEGAYVIIAKKNGKYFYTPGSQMARIPPGAEINLAHW